LRTELKFAPLLDQTQGCGFRLAAEHMRRVMGARRTFVPMAQLSDAMIDLVGSWMRARRRMAALMRKLDTSRRLFIWCVKELVEAAEGFVQKPSPCGATPA